MKVNFFVTCLGDTVKAEVAKKTVQLLEQLECEVIFPERQGCCGQPALNSGYIEKSKPAMKSMIEAFEINDYPIVTPAGSCAASVKKYPHYLEDEPEWAARAQKVADRLFELTQFVVRQLGVENVGARLKGKGVYHPSCSLIRKLGVREEPLILLNNVEGLELLPIDNQETCCGFGGTFSVKMSEISGEMVTEKVQHISAVKPDFLIGADISCLLNIGGRISREGQPIKVMHIVDVLMSR
ncbi:MULTISPECIES: (Fe-S)-binding protein [Photobacterium]|uniref:(Fe-S)-binding protein n=1 Tax=Photobacterium piscicola TaxID=1378299 RepID=A0A1T5HYI4_9GAMM|nr:MULTISPECIES: (Fe-S)-binding protein [Photobacterium]MEC6795609.1 (Fe-S)-binding protein [Photobacterium sp. S4TG1]MEC6815975.1 (Fe-S)-binding protein [Photobacterium toruni]MEC6822275.1 (Fe-S)-binding protein [Photobacterium piscicola]MEC6881167.1 (Fe-S)-binding protein [Photobacterium piscicola]MEC6897318.1 (Fe-S)-binding protein [Photobacterium piscicola]